MSVLILGVNSEFVDSDQHILQSVKALKAWAKQLRVRQVCLILSADWVLSYKVYIATSAMVHAELLLRELDTPEPLQLKDLFYDYVQLESSLPELSAYQLVVVKKITLMPALKMLKAARLKVQILSPQIFPDMNLLPWRARAARRRVVLQLAKLFLVPGLLLLILLGVYGVLQSQNSRLNEQIAFYYNQNVQQQVGEREMLERFLLAVNLVQQVPVDEVEYAHQVWRLDGRLDDLADLAGLNETLTKLHWLSVGVSVDVHQQDQHYVWQLQKSGMPS